MFTAETFRLMKPTAFLINLARGGLVERDGLLHALKNGLIAGAGLDVFWTEPPEPDDEIFSYNVVATPHIGGVTDVSLNGIADGVAGNIARVERGEVPLYKK